MSQYFIGLISGTSADGIDAVVVDFESSGLNILAQQTYPYPAEVRQDILNIAQPSQDHAKHRIDRLGHLDHRIGQLFAAAAAQICADASINMNDIVAIGSHGQTVRHRPQTSTHFSMQIGDPNVIAYETGCLTVADFRRMDIAAGGQGAPLVPLFHQHLFQDTRFNRVILNLGGIANITWLPKDSNEVLGFDTGPANALCDLWINQQLDRAFDDQGQWAAGGLVSEELLKHMMADPYFLLPAPKSTGREYFDEQWLTQKLKGADPQTPQDIQATLVDLSAKSIALQIDKLPDPCHQVFVCGGGSHNAHLLNRLQFYMDRKVDIQSLDTLDGSSDFIEAATFAWLAKQRLDNHRVNYCSVTGAKNPVLLGGIYQA